MLTLYDLRLNIITLEWLCKLTAVPFTLDVSAHVAKPSNSKITWRCWHFRHILVLTVICFKLFRLGQTILWPEIYLDLKNLFVQIIYLTLAVVYEGGLQLVLHMSNELATLFLRMHRNKSWDPADSHGLVELISLGVLRKHSVLEIVIMFLPLITYAVIPGGALVFSIESKAAHLIYSALPDNMQNWFTFLVLLLVELWSLTEFMTIAYIGVYLLMTFPLPYICNDAAASIFISIRSERNSKFSNLLMYCHQMKEIWLDIKLYNEVFAAMNYMVKLLLLVITIFGLFAGINFYEDHPHFAAVLTFVGFIGVSYFLFMYGRCYLVQDNIIDLKRAIMSAVDLKDEKQKQYFKRALNAIPVIGIRAGGFYTLDRTSSPEFMDFVINQIVSLLVSNQ